MKTRRLGPNGPEVSAIGLGCMGMAAFYGTPSDESQATAVIHRALDLGVTLFDTAEMYGPHTNEIQLGKALADRRDKAFVATKFGIGYNADRTALKVDGSPANVRRAIEGSLKRLNMDHVDLYYLHRVDADTPIEETVGRDGRAGDRGQGAVPGSVRGGARTPSAGPTRPIRSRRCRPNIRCGAASRRTRSCMSVRELGHRLRALQPAGSWVSCRARSSRSTTWQEDDFRRTNPRFMGENFQKNLNLVEAVKAIAHDRGVTAAQLALAWVLAQGDDLVPIPGTRRIETLEQNAAAADITLTAEDVEAIEAVFPKNAASGHRYAEAARSALNR